MVTDGFFVIICVKQKAGNKLLAPALVSIYKYGAVAAEEAAFSARRSIKASRARSFRH